MNVTDENKTLVQTARACERFCEVYRFGEGSIIGVYEDDEVLNKLVVALRRINARVIKPIYFVNTMIRQSSYSRRRAGYTIFTRDEGTA